MYYHQSRLVNNEVSVNGNCGADTYLIFQVQNAAIKTGVSDSRANVLKKVICPSSRFPPVAKAETNTLLSPLFEPSNSRTFGSQWFGFT
jgi:hypothetical protein